MQLERLGHDTQFEKEVHANMTSNNINFEQQKKMRDKKNGIGGVSGGGVSGGGEGVGGGGESNEEATVTKENMKNEGAEDNRPEVEVEDTSKVEVEVDTSEVEVDMLKKKRQHAKIVNIEKDKILMNLPGSGMRYFKFDHVINSHSGSNNSGNSQEDVYLGTGLPVLNSFLQGFSACMLVYGQTGR